MTSAAFVRALDRGRARADKHATKLAAVYEKTLRAAAATAARTLVADAALTASDWQPPAEGALYAPAGVSAALQAAHLSALEATLRPALDLAGIGWNPAHPDLAALLAQTGAWSGQAIDEAFQPEVRRIVADSFRDGLSVRDTAALIRSAFAETAPWQAEMLARSNLNMLGNAGTQVAVTRFNDRARAAGEKPIASKTWLTAGDSAVRATHAAAAGQTVPVADSFQVGGSSLQFPGDPGGALKEILNCRCTVLYGEAARGGLTAALSSPTMPPKRRGNVTAATIPQVAWISDLAFEGEATADGRYMLPRSISWRELPLTLMAMTVTDDGHDGAFVAGRIDKVNRSSKDIDGQPLAEGVTSIRGGGIFDMGGDNGAEIARLVGDETLRGVSVDLAIIDWLFRDPETGDLIEPEDLTDDQMEQAFWGDLQYAVRAGDLLAATVCPTPAFADAKIALAASGQQVLRLTSTFELVNAEALAAAAAPVLPPRDWFYRAEPAQATPLTVTDDGRVYGHIAAWGTCHIGRPGECFQPPSSPSGYAYFNLGEIPCRDGKTVACGQITIGTDHAPLASSWREAKAHYEQTGRCIADVHAVDGQHGIWVSGALRPHVTDAQRREIGGAKPSGHWCQISPGGPLELVGVLEVNHPGYPVPRTQLALAASAAHPGGEPVALIAAGLVGDEDFDRRLDVLEARFERGRDGLAAIIG